MLKTSPDQNKSLELNDISIEKLPESQQKAFDTLSPLGKTNETNPIVSTQTDSTWAWMKLGIGLCLLTPVLLLGIPAAIFFYKKFDGPSEGW